MPSSDPFRPSAPQGPAPTPGQGTEPAPYDFIMNPPTLPKRPFSLGGSSKLPYIAIGGVALVVILFVIMLLGGNKGLDPSLLSIAQQQTEIARVAGLQYSNLPDSPIRGFVLNTQLSMQSDQADYLAFLSAHGSGINSKQLGGAENSQTDAALSSAQQSGSLNSAVTTVLRDELSHYQQTIKTAYDHSHAAATHQQLQSLSDQAGLLIQQSKQQ